MTRLSNLQASADTQGRLIHCTEVPVMQNQVSLCTGGARGLHPSVLQSGKVSTPCVGAQRHACATDYVFHAIMSFPFLQKNHLGPRPDRLLTGRGAAARPEGAEQLLQQSSGQPDPTELHLPSQWGLHAPVLLALNSQSLLIHAAPAPYAIPAISNCVAATLPLLSNAFALLLPLPGPQLCR